MLEGNLFRTSRKFLHLCVRQQYNTTNEPAAKQGRSLSINCLKHQPTVSGMHDTVYKDNMSSWTPEDSLAGGRAKRWCAPSRNQRTRACDPPRQRLPPAPRTQAPASPSPSAAAVGSACRSEAQ